MIVLSPHLDDAVWSASSLLDSEGVTVVTICAGIPPEHIDLSSFDRASGFSSGVAAVVARRREDKAASAVGQFTAVWLDCLDSQYNYGVPDPRIAGAVRMVSKRAAEKGEQVVGPVGLRHPDHKAVAEALPDDAWKYEELPYTYIWPEGEATAEPMDPPNWKSEAVHCYASQIGPTTHLAEILELPERIRR